MKKTWMILLSALLYACSGDNAHTTAPPGQQAPGQSGDKLSAADQELLSSLSFPGEVATASPTPTLRQPKPETIYNAEAVIPPQCYTKHEAKYNPCMTCHQTYPYRSRPNTMDDGSQQVAYLFSDIGEVNHWTNLFEDRRERIEKISDQHVLDYIHTDNYSPLIEQLKNTRDWQGPIPELKNLALGAEAFDELGFAKDGSHWVAFNYKPLPSTFWPTNGATDDVMIRLPAKFRQAGCGGDGQYSKDAYLANLSILEMAIKDLHDISTPDIDERAFCVDLNGDEQLSVVNRIKRPEHYVGDAADEVVATMLYPLGTEFLHSVRYVGINEGGEITVPPRMKELRYMNKFVFYPPEHLVSMYGNERQEKVDELIPKYINRGDKGTDNSFGWMMLGFIEDEQGSLRMQSEEENLFCMGCHTTVGTTIDQTFAFARKVTGSKGWSYINLKGMQDAPYVGQEKVDGEVIGEIADYLATVGGGNEFRENAEIRQRFLNEDGSLNTAALAGKDVYQLITPSLRRALDLNKAYMTIVADQDFVHGRDPNIAPAVNVYREIDPETASVLPADKVRHWDLRLNWQTEQAAP